MAVFRTTFFSNFLRRLTEMTAIVPVERAAGIPEELRAKSDSPMKTVMLLHGYSGTHSDWLYGSRIEQLAMKYHIAVLCPSGENGFYVNDRKRDALYEQLLCEVIDFGRRVFPLSCKREDTIIGGFSMGGYGALINGFKHPELFGGVIALSAAAITDDLAKMDSYEDNPTAMASPSYYEHIFGLPKEIPGSDRDLRFVARQLAESDAPKPQIYMACGTEDMLVRSSNEFSAYLDSIGLKHTYVTDPGIHNWAFWDPHIEMAFEEMLGTK